MRFLSRQRFLLQANYAECTWCGGLLWTRCSSVICIRTERTLVYIYYTSDNGYTASPAGQIYSKGSYGLALMKV